MRMMDKELYKAAVSGDVEFLNEQHEFVRVALTSFPGQNTSIERLLCQRNSDGNTPCHVAVEVGSVDVIKLLLDYNGAGQEKGASCGEFEVVQLLLLEVHDRLLVQDINESHQTPLHLAINCNATQELYAALVPWLRLDDIV
ncbi:Caskin-1 [Bienertia sinuspersici]